MELIPFAEEHDKYLIEWSTDPDFLLQWAGSRVSYPLTTPQLEKLRELGRRDPAELYLYTPINEDGNVMGHGEIGDLDRRNRSGVIKRILIGPPYQKKGNGTKLMRLLLKKGFLELDLHRIELLVFSFNQRAIHCYETVGFKREGILRDARKSEEEFWDLIVMSVLRTDAIASELIK